MSRNLPRRIDGSTFDWLYRENPHGKAHVWVGSDTKGNVAIGAAAAFPRRIYFDGQEALSWVLGDFFVDDQYRSLGPALRLQRACLEVTESNGGLFCYDFPSATMVAVYQRLGFAVTGKMLRLAKLLRVDRRVRETIAIPVAQRALTAVGNTLLKYAPTRVMPDQSLEIAVHEGPCDEEFSILAREQGGRLGICLQRSAEYLNWRYVNNPLARYEFITARRRGSLKGYAIWTQAGEDASVVDLFGENDPAIVKGLLAEICGHLTRCGVMTLSVWLNELHLWLSWCSEMGFRVRESAPVVCIPARSLGKAVNLSSKRWFLMQGDRDS